VSGLWVILAVVIGIGVLGSIWGIYKAHYSRHTQSGRLRPDAGQNQLHEMHAMHDHTGDLTGHPGDMDEEYGDYYYDPAKVRAGDAGCACWVCPRSSWGAGERFSGRWGPPGDSKRAG
jgi:hypothetical protein